MSSLEFNSTLDLLVSNKINERKKGVERILVLLKDDEQLKQIDRDVENWKMLILAVQKYLFKESEKYVEKPKTKKPTFSNEQTIFQVFEILIQKDCFFDPKSLLSFVIDVLSNSTLSQHYKKDAFQIINVMVPEPFIRNYIEKSQWKEIYTKTQGSKDFFRVCDSSGSSISVLMKIIKYGPLHSFPEDLLRDQFDFITQICQQLTSQLHDSIQSNVIEMAYYFCLHTAKDNRMACCKLGEEVIPFFMALYVIQNPRNIQIKNNIIKFILLQFALHHPKGISDSSVGAYAFSWTKWNDFIFDVYNKLTEDVEYNMKRYINPKFSIYLPTYETNGIKMLSENFAQVYIECIKQIYYISDVNIENCEDRVKKMKRTPPIEDLISFISESNQKWVWVNLTSNLLNSYPQLVAPHFLQLLQTLSKVQVDCKDPNYLHHLYDCLINLYEIQKENNIENTKKIAETWNVIKDTTIRTFGLNLENKKLHQLLEKFVRNLEIRSEILLPTYLSGVLNVTENYVKTLDVVLEFANISNVNSNEFLIKWILSEGKADIKSKSYEYLSKISTAKVLVSLILKKWPQWKTTTDNKKKYLPYEDIENIYLNTSFQKYMCDQSPRNKKLKSTDTINEDNEVDENLKIKLENYTKSLIVELCNHEGNELIYVLSLLKNMTSFMFNFGILNETNDQKYILIEAIDRIWKRINDYIDGLHGNQDDELRIKKIHECVNVLNFTFKSSVNYFVDYLFRALVPVPVLQMFLKILNDPFKVRSSGFGSLKVYKAKMTDLKNDLVEILTNFCYGLGTIKLDNQNNLFQALIVSDCLRNFDNNVPLNFLKFLINCDPEINDEGHKEGIMSFLINLCSEKYKYYDYALEILKALYELYPMIANGESTKLKTGATEILKKFYGLLNNYGPRVSIALINCIGKLYEVDPYSNFAKWDNKEVVLFLPDFLCSDFYEVRMAAVKNIALFFRTSSSAKLLNLFHLQEIMFSEIVIKCEKVFEVKGNISNERSTDETVTRSVSVLYTLGSIIISSYLWRNEALFTLFKMVHQRKLNYLQNILTTIAKELNVKSYVLFLERALNLLLRKWSNEGLLVHDFPFYLFDTTSPKLFYEKYLTTIMPLIIEYNIMNLEDFSKLMQTDIKILTEKTLPEIYAFNLIKSCSENNAKDINAILKHFFNDEEIKETCFKSLDNIILIITSYVKDESSFEKKFTLKVTFSKDDELTLSETNFQNCISRLSILYGSDIFQVLMERHVDKLQKLSMELNLKIYKAISEEEKLLAFYHYCLINDLILYNINSSDFVDYFVRDTSFNLLRIIKNYRSNISLAEIAIKYLKQIFDCTDRIGQHLNAIVTLLIQVISDDSDISKLCLRLLEFVVIENKDKFMPYIKELEDFPDSPLFFNVSNVRNSLKNLDDSMVLFNEEIYNFISSGKLSLNNYAREDNLIKLRKLLHQEKKPLEVLLKRLDDLRGFSEDCENSLLHQLVTILVDLSCSKNKRVSIEALKCLGEIGPLNLKTLVFRPEKRLSYVHWTPMEFLAGQVISWLLVYIIDEDFNLIKPSADILYQILNTNEGKKVIKSSNDFGYGEINDKYLTPFLAKKTSTYSFKVDQKIFLEMIDDDQLWFPKNCEHNQWIKILVCSLLKTVIGSYVPQLIHICEIKVSFCELLLPTLIYLILTLNSSPLTKILSNKINGFFNDHHESAKEMSSQKWISLNKRSIQCVLNVLQFIKMHKDNLKIKKNFADLNLEYLKVAFAAQYCSAHFTALLYVDMWAYDKKEKIKCDVDFGNNILEVVCNNENIEVANSVQDLLRNSYKAIGELDGLPGCSTLLFAHPDLRVEYYKDNGMWDQAILHYNLRMDGKSNGIKSMLLDSLKHCGLYESTKLFGEQDETDWECVWRLGDWTVEENKNERGGKNFDNVIEKCKYFALKSLCDKNIKGVMKHIENARLDIADKLKHTSLESSSNIYLVLSHLQSFNEIEEFASINCEDADEIKNLVSNWSQKDSTIRNDFLYIEPIMYQRALIFIDYFKRTNESFYKEYCLDFAIKLSEKSRLENLCHIGRRMLHMIDTACLNQNEKYKVCLEDAQLCWSTKNENIAYKLLEKMSSNTSIEPRLKSQALKLLGKWNVETPAFSQHSHDIIKDYFLAALQMYNDLKKTNEDEKNIFEIYDIMGRFADQRYQQISSHIASDDFQKKVKNCQKTKELVKQIESNDLNQDQKKAKVTHKRQSDLDEIEISNAKKEKDRFLLMALKYYLTNLAQTDENNLRVFRIMALFLENRLNSNINPIIDKNISQIPSYKFLNIIPQLIPHIGENDDLFTQKTNEIIDRCAKDHPHHTVPLLMAMANSQKDTQYSNSQTDVNTDRVNLARKWLKNLKQCLKIVDIVKEFEKLSEALIELAYYKPESIRRDQKRYEIPKNCKITSVTNFTCTALITNNVKISKSCNYGNIVGIRAFEKYFNFVGGINAPKRIVCIGTDGIKREQLIKGQDDLRQDAVMQQVFNIMNTLLAQNKKTNGLLIRTYKIVPLSMRSGILEWANNTMPIGAYLTGDKDEKCEGAHQQFRPQDTPPHKCRSLLQTVIGKTNEEKLKMFMKICEQIKPVFHKFFETQFLHPTEWYERRRAYIRSVATSSMCGYVLGIGDRHVSNILIDKTTAEVVHIDFGIAFEQGRILPTPETVPFRLSRDFVDGMGILGVEGAFKRYCEKTMTVLRENSHVIMMILEVLLYDPLYAWTLTAVEARKRQTEDSDNITFKSLSPTSEDSVEINSTAERALLRLKAKLCGIEDGNPLSVERQVNTLIRQAMDPANLSKLFNGWQAYL